MARPALSKAETEIARIVWQLRKATVRQVWEQLPAERQVEYKTVQTYLRRLEQKGYVHAGKDQRSTVYSPRVRPGQVIKESVKDFLDRLFDGEALPLMEHLVRERGLTTDEVERLRELLNELESEDDRP